LEFLEKRNLQGISASGEVLRLYINDDPHVPGLLAGEALQAK
jgi:hypothetical protein